MFAMDLKLARDGSGEPEIFRSVQGEGKAVGRIRTFIRLSGCNLHCVWCDTAYTWNWVGSEFPHRRDQPGKPYKFEIRDEMVKVSVADVAARVRELTSTDGEPSPGVVITGGEPLMQREGVIALIDALKARQPDLSIEVETNGSIAPSSDLLARVDLFMVSPKLGHSGNDPATAMNRTALGVFARDEGAVFKFVARDEADVAMAARLVDELGVPKARVYIMPEGTTSEVLIARGKELVTSVVAHGFNYTDRLHIHLFGEKRGV